MPPKSRTITVKNQQPSPNGEVEVTPDGSIIFDNQDNKNYLLRLSSKDNSTKDFPLPANGQAIVPIQKDDEFMYDILNEDGSAAVLSAAASASGAAAGGPTATPSTGTGGGPIKN